MEDSNVDSASVALVELDSQGSQAKISSALAYFALLETSPRYVVHVLFACLLASKSSNSQLMNNSTLPSPHLHILVNSTERPMKIEIVVDPSRPASLASRVAPAPAPAASAPEGAARCVRLTTCLHEIMRNSCS